MYIENSKYEDEYEGLYITQVSDLDFEVEFIA